MISHCFPLWKHIKVYYFLVSNFNLYLVLRISPSRAFACASNLPTFPFWFIEHLKANTISTLYNCASPKQSEDSGAKSNAGCLHACKKTLNWQLLMFTAFIDSLSPPCVIPWSLSGLALCIQHLCIWRQILGISLYSLLIQVLTRLEM